jgi:hypothetical protein
MMTIDEIRAGLYDKRLIIIAKSTGISYGTLLAIRNNRDVNPSLKTMQTLSAYLKSGPHR